MSPAVTMDRKDAEYEINSELFNRSFENLEDRILTDDFNGFKDVDLKSVKKVVRCAFRKCHTMHSLQDTPLGLGFSYIERKICRRQTDSYLFKLFEIRKDLKKIKTPLSSKNASRLYCITMKVIKLRKKIQKLAFIKSSSGDERYFRSRLHKPKKICTPKHVPSSWVCQFLHLQNQKQQAFTAVTLLTMLIVIWTFK